MTTKMTLPPLKMAQWPQPDRELWLESRQPARLFDTGGFAAKWRPATIRSVEQGYGIYLSWLGQTHGLDASSSPIERVDQDRIEAFVSAYRPGRSDLTVAGTVRGVAYVVRATNPPHGLPWLTKLAHRLTNTAQPSRPKLPRMATVPELVSLGRQLMEDGWARLQQDQVSGAQVFRDGLVIASLAMRPLRLRNLTALRLGHTVFIEKAGVRVAFDGKGTKTAKPIQFAYPVWLAEPFTIYVGEVRPRLLARSTGPDEGWLWIGRRGRPLGGIEMAERIATKTKKHLGSRISPHLFRDCAATDIALLDPQHIGITKSVLQHSTLASSQKYYNQATSFSAVRRFETVIEAIRTGKKK